MTQCPTHNVLGNISTLRSAQRCLLMFPTSEYIWLDYLLNKRNSFTCSTNVHQLRFQTLWTTSPTVPPGSARIEAQTIAPTAPLEACREDPVKPLPKILLEDWRKEKQGLLILLSTDMILKPWYCELESPWILISKTLILAPLTAGLAFTLTSRQLLLKISHGNFILFTICFPPLSPRSLLQLLMGLQCILIQIRRGEGIPDPFIIFWHKKVLILLFSCWSWKENLKAARMHHGWAGGISLLLLLLLGASSSSTHSSLIFSYQQINMSRAVRGLDLASCWNQVKVSPLAGRTALQTLWNSTEWKRCK